MTFQKFLESPEGRKCLETPFPYEPSMSQRLQMAFDAGFNEGWDAGSDKYTEEEP